MFRPNRTRFGTVDDMQLEPFRAGEGIDDVHHLWPRRAVIVAREDAANPEFRKPLIERSAFLFAGVGVSIDVDEVEVIVLEQVERLVKAHFDERMASPEGHQPRERTQVLVDIVSAVARIHVNTVEKRQRGRPQDTLGEYSFGHAQLDADASWSHQFDDIVPHVQFGIHGSGVRVVPFRR